MRISDLRYFTGEILEKATRVLTDEEKALLDQEWVGKNGTKRKLEVPCPFLTFVDRSH